MPSEAKKCVPIEVYRHPLRNDLHDQLYFMPILVGHYPQHPQRNDLQEPCSSCLSFSKNVRPSIIFFKIMRDPSLVDLLD